MTSEPTVFETTNISQSYTLDLDKESVAPRADKRRPEIWATKTTKLALKTPNPARVVTEEESTDGKGPSCTVTEVSRPTAGNVRDKESSKSPKKKLEQRGGRKRSEDNAAAAKHPKEL